MINKIVIALFFILASFAIAFSATTDVEDVDIVVKIWKEVQVYVDTNEFGYYYTNDHHIDKIFDILKRNGIIGKKDYWIAVLGEHGTGKPVAVIVQIQLNGNEYLHKFEIKNVKPKGESEPACENTGSCA